MSSTEVELRYFAWVRERVGTDAERIVLPEGATTPRALIDHLAGRGEGYALAFANPDVIRVAVDKKVANPAAPLDGCREIAFFPPMTGG